MVDQNKERVTNSKSLSLNLNMIEILKEENQ